MGWDWTAKWMEGQTDKIDNIWIVLALLLGTINKY